jgi:hypothetical protein
MLVSCLLGGCFLGRAGIGCADTERYADSRSTGPLRVPDDLSLPDESDSISVPPPSRSTAPSANAQPGSCLELPPDFAKQRQAAAASDQSEGSRRSRRRARKAEAKAAAERSAPAQTAGSAADTPSAEPPSN